MTPRRDSWRRAVRRAAVVHAPRLFLRLCEPTDAELGACGEELAARCLVRRGLRPLGRRVSTPHAEIDLHVFANTPEDVIFFLLDSDIPFSSSARRLRLNQDEYADFPAITLERDGVVIDLTEFWQRAERDVPWSPVDGRPMKRANARQVQALIDAAEAC